jgi:hypothetical protein
MLVMILLDREYDGRWIATIDSVMGISTARYGNSKREAICNAKSSFLMALAFKIEDEEIDVETISFGVEWSDQCSHIR